jgi:hypothetical protein
MVRIQNESMGAQIQILKNNVSAIFMLRDANYEGTEFMNAFHEAVVTGVESLRNLLIVETEGGMVLTTMGQQIQDIAVQGISMFVEMIQELIPLIRQFTESGGMNVELLKVYLIPLTLVVKAIDLLGPGIVKVVIAYSMLNKTLGLSIILEKLYKNNLYISNIQRGIRNMLTTTAIYLGATRFKQKNLSILQLIRLNAMYLYYNILQKSVIARQIRSIALTIYDTAVKWLNTAATWAGVSAATAFNIATGGLIILAAVLVVGLVIVIRKFFEWKDVMHGVMVMFTHVKNFIVWFAKGYYNLLIKPFVDLGKAVWNLMEGPFFRIFNVFHTLL